MTRDPNEPLPEQLAAYLDGELTESRRAELDAWMADHPDAVPGAEGTFADREDSLVRAWQATQPTEPSPVGWENVLNVVETGMRQPQAGPRGRRLLWWFLGAGAAAAIIIAAAFLMKTLGPRQLEQPGPAPKEEVVVVTPPQPESDGLDEPPGPFQVMSPAQVRIISMDGCDTSFELFGEQAKMLVVGDPPVNDDEILPAGKTETTMLNYDIDDSWGVPLIIDPVVLNKEWHP